MYLNFYQLRKEPFNITPDPELLFLSPSHREALATALYGVKQRKGMVAIIGEVGVGKTTILRSFLDRVNTDRLKAVYLFNADLSFKALLRSICRGLGRSAEGDDSAEMVDRLHRILIEEYRAGNNVVLVIDEAQNMPVETLESLRMLSNLETATDKLIQVVFSGQPEFEETLAAPCLRQLKQRIAITARILPLSPKESRAYIEHRLSSTATGENELFDRAALRLIVKRAAGIPRVINILCDNCLITSFGRRQKRVDAKVAREIVAAMERARPAPRYWRGALAAGVFASALGLAVVPAGRQDQAARGLPQATPGTAAAPGSPHKEEPLPPAAPLPSGERGGGANWAGQVVRKGDTLAKLILEKYGYVDRRLIERVKRSNPAIVDENLIVEGEQIHFPERD